MLYGAFYASFAFVPLLVETALGGNSTNQTSPSTMGIKQKKESPDVDIIAVYFRTPWRFYLLHACALCCMAASIAASLALVAHILKKHKSKFWSANEGDRIAVYISINDLLFCLCHISDHVLLMARPLVTSQSVCAGLAFLVQLFGMAQAMNVALAALFCLLNVVANRKVGFGPYDWRLHTVAYLPNIVFSSVLYGMGVLGPSGVW